MRLVFLVALLLVSACSADDESGPCVERDGTFTMRLTARSGNCGNYAESVIHLTPGGAALQEGCDGYAQDSQNHCSLRSDYACPLPTLGPAYRGTFSGEVHWDHEGRAASGVLEYGVTNAGAFVCQGTYDVQVTKE